MAEIPLQDFDGVQFPKRRPWLVLVAVLVIVGFVLWRQFGSSDMAPKPVAKAPLQPVPAVVVAPDPESNATPAAPGIPAVAPEVTRLMEQARQALARAAEDALAPATARRLYLDALKLDVDPHMCAEIESYLDRLNVELALTPLPLPGVKVEYVVKPGDSVDRIAKRLGVTTHLIERSNQLANPNRIKAGDKFSILTGRFAIAVNKTDRVLVVYLNDEYFKRYHVGTGKFGKTPTGQFVIYDKIVEPVWWRPDGKEVPFGNPENILGTRWMAIRAFGETPDVRGYGIHGTWDDASIGKAESLGCIRMHNGDVEELFDIIPVETLVVITE